MRKMFKNFMLLTLCITLLGLLFACGNDKPEKVGIYLDNTTIEFNTGETLDLFKGVSTYDASGKLMDSVKEVTVNHAIPVDGEGKLTASGNYNVKYSITINNVLYTIYRTVKVNYVLPVTDDIIANGDFETGSVDPFVKSEFDQGAATVVVEKIGDNHLLKVDVTNVSWQQASPRLDYTGVKLDANKFYEISFDAYAAVARTIHVQIGELIDSDPWFRQCGKDSWFADLGVESKNFSFRFKPSTSAKANLENLSLLIEFGKMMQGESVATTCYLDNIKIIEVEDLGIKSVLEPTEIASGKDEPYAKANPEQVAVWYVQSLDWSCGPIVTLNSATLENKVITVDVTQPAGAYWFATQLFLYSKKLAPGWYDASFKVKSDVAGDVTINGTVHTLEVGENEIKFTAKTNGDDQFGIIMQLGVEKAGTNLGSAKIEVSEILVVAGKEPVEIEYADPSNLLGKILEVKNGAEKDASDKPGTFVYWHVADVSWGFGDIVPVTVNLDKTDLIVTSSQKADTLWYATQLFFYTKAIKDAGSHKFTVTIDANMACKVTICGQAKDLVKGINELTFDFDNKAGDQFAFKFQAGYYDANLPNQGAAAAGDLKFIFSKFAIDGVLVESNENPDPQTGDYNVSVNTGDGGAWLKFTVNWKESVAKVTSVKPGAIKFGGRELAYTGPVGVDELGDNSITFGAGFASAEFMNQDVTLVLTLVTEEKEILATITFNSPNTANTDVKVNSIVIGDVKPDPDPDPDPQTGDYNVAVNTGDAGAWLKFTVSWKESVAKVTAVKPGVIKFGGRELIYTGPVGVDVLGENSITFGAGFASAEFMNQDVTLVLTLVTEEKEILATITFNSPNVANTDVKVTSLVIGDVEPDPDPDPDPVDLFGKPNEAVVEDGEGKALTNPNTFHFWYVKDAGWNCGPAVTASYTYENGVFTINTDQPADAYWYATQLFYYTNPAKVAGSYELKFKLTASMKTEITICDKVIALVEGENEIVIPVTLAKDQRLMFDLQCGANNSAVTGPLTLVLKDFTLAKAEEVEPEPQTGEYVVAVNTADGGAWLKFTISWKDGSEKVTSVAPGSLFFNARELAYTGPVGAVVEEANSYTFGAGFVSAEFMNQDVTLTLTVTTATKTLDITFTFNSPNAANTNVAVTNVVIK